MTSNLSVSLPECFGKTSNEAEEKFRSVDISSVRFPSTWVFWESMKQDGRDKQSTFIDNNFTLFEFADMEALAKIWRTKISSVSSFFTFDGKSVRFQDATKRFRSIEGICLFKKGIQPAWEDAANSHGGEFQIMFENIDQKPEVIDAIFRDVIVTILSSEYKFQEETNGIRIVDKSRDGKTKIRLEIWFDFSNKSEEAKKRIKELSDIFSAVILRHYPSIDDLQFKNHKH